MRWWRSAVTGLVILAIDTATQACSVALNLRGEITQRREIAPQGHSKLVLDMVAGLLRQAGLALKQVDIIAVDVGPGSFTGVRIGLGVAQGLAYGAGLMVAPVGSLAALAHGAAQSLAVAPSSAAAAPLLWAAIDARMQQIYHALYRHRAGAEPQPIIAPALIAPQDVGAASRALDSAARDAPIIGLGSGWDRYAAIMLAALAADAAGASPEQTARGRAQWLPERYPQAAAVAQIAAARGRAAAIPALQLTACYIREQVAAIPAAPTSKDLKTMARRIRAPVAHRRSRIHRG